MSTPQWYAGQEVIVRRRVYGGKHQETPARISRVGRKYVYVDGRGRETAYDAVTGVEKSEFATRRIFTPESLAEHFRRTDVQERLREATRSFWWISQLSTDDAERVLQILTNDKEQGS